MNYSLFQYPLPAPPELEDLNAYLSRHRVAGVTQYLAATAGGSMLVFVVETVTAAADIQYLGNFFLDDLHAHEALILIPPPELQQRLATLLQAGSVLKLHAPQYNMVAHPFSTRYQNSNQWVLETLAAALAPAGSVDSRASAQAWLKDAGFAPTTLAISTLERLGARVSRANIAFDDHPPERRFAGRIDTVSVESVAGFLLRRAGGTQSLTVGVE